MPAHVPSDLAERQTALTALDRTLLVEAGAGSGKTAILAGRIVMLLASGVEPKHIAGITFTEIAASQLRARIGLFLDEVLEKRIPVDLSPAFPAPPTEGQLENLRRGRSKLEELSATTIHGFCQSLIRPYPVEANLDPGARVVEPAEAELVFEETLDRWLRRRLSVVSRDDDVITEMLLADERKSLELMREMALFLRSNRGVQAPPAAAPGSSLEAFRTGVVEFRRWFDQIGAREAETLELLEAFEILREECCRGGQASEAEMLFSLVGAQSPLMKKDGGIFAYKSRKQKWEFAVRAAGLWKLSPSQLNDEAKTRYDACREAFTAAREPAAGRILERLVNALHEVTAEFFERKRRAAMLDFDDLLYLARDLLRSHEPVRHALGERYRHVLVDEFQDTDPLQSEILWRLCGDPVAAPQAPLDGPSTGSGESLGENGEDHWLSRQIREGALFLVGDPKQAIYRFRGADVGAYLAAREAIRARDESAIVSISTNFRSVESILRYVNERFTAPLEVPGQPGFTPLSPFHGDAHSGPFIAAVDIEVPRNDKGQADVSAQREAEAKGIASTCGRLIGRLQVRAAGGGSRPCRAADIALLAPTGTELWYYERALEDAGISVATQAGKGYYHRQEVQDLIAIARVLSDSRDTLALGSLLRGPLVGLTEEEMLDIVAALPADPNDPDRPARLWLWMPFDSIAHGSARNVVKTLQGLARRVSSTTPFELLSEAVEELRVRPKLRIRHPSGPERALANVDLFLESTRRYAVRGLRTFVETMRVYWEKPPPTEEANPDNESDSIWLITMHSAKGLEWPVVIPINTMGMANTSSTLVHDRGRNLAFARILGADPPGFIDARSREDVEQKNERVRLWYVATTRAMDLLLLPRIDCSRSSSAWASLVDLGVDALPAFDSSKLEGPGGEREAESANAQSHDQFVEEAARVAALVRRVERVTPSRNEGPDATVVEVEGPVMLDPLDDGAEPAEIEEPPVQGGRERGLVLHKLMEEILTGESSDEEASLVRRAAELIHEVGLDDHTDAKKGPSSKEVARTVMRTLSIPEVAMVRSSLVPELWVHSSGEGSHGERLVSGIADAISVRPDGSIALVIDWKSDVRQPARDTLGKYRQQLAEYVAATSAPEGLIVFMTTGKLERVLSSDPRQITLGF